MSSARVLDRMDRRVDELCGSFAAHLALFSTSEPFAGPSLYFHRKTLDLRRRHASILSLAEDEAYVDAAYATLTAWGALLGYADPDKAPLAVSIYRVLASCLDGEDIDESEAFDRGERRYRLRLIEDLLQGDKVSASPFFL